MRKDKIEAHMKNTFNLNETENTEIKNKIKFVKLQMNNKEVMFHLNTRSDVTLINERTRKNSDRLTLLKTEKNFTWNYRKLT